MAWGGKKNVPGVVSTDTRAEWLTFLAKRPLLPVISRGIPSHLSDPLLSTVTSEQLTSPGTYIRINCKKSHVETLILEITRNIDRIHKKRRAHSLESSFFHQELCHIKCELVKIIYLLGSSNTKRLTTKLSFVKPLLILEELKFILDKAS